MLDGMLVGHVVVDASWTLVHADRLEALAETAVRLAHLPRHEL